MVKRNFDEQYESNEPLIGQAALADIAEKQPGIITPRGEVCSVEQKATIQEKSEAEGSATFVVVTRGKEENRHGNKVQIKENKYGGGLLVDQYAMNPVVLFEHGHVTPIPMGMAQKDKGSPVELRMNSTKAISKVYFNQGIQIVEDVANLVFGNAIRMASIGFNVRKVMKLARKPNSTAEGVEDVTQYFGGYDFVEALLMEWSITVLGADAGALKQSASRKAVNGHSLSERMVQYLTAAAGPLVKQNQSGFNGWNALWNPDEPQTKQSAFWMPEDDEPQGGTQTQSTEPNVEVLRFTPEKFREIINNEVQSAIDKLSEAGKAGAESGQQYAQEIGAGVDNNSGNVEIQQSQSEEIIRFDQIEQQYSEQKTQSEPPLTAEQIAAAVTQQVNNALEPRFEKLEKDANKFEQQLRQATGQLPG